MKNLSGHSLPAGVAGSRAPGPARQRLECASLLALSGRGAATVAAACSGAVGESGDKSPHSKRWREIEYPASDGVRADKAVRAPVFAMVQSTLLALVVLALLCSSTTLLVVEASEARYRVIKIIEGSGTSVPEAGGNQSERPGGRLD